MERFIQKGSAHMMKQLFAGRRPIFFLTLCLTFLFWLFLLAHTVITQFTSLSQKTIPAFLNTETIQQTTLESLFSEAEILNKTTARIPLSAVPGCQPKRLPGQNSILSLLNQYDGKLQLISCHREKNYTDFYFYSPKVNQYCQPASFGNFNLQTAVTDKYVYFGIPLIQYDF